MPPDDMATSEAGTTHEHYTVAVEQASRLIAIRYHGVWTREIAVRFLQDLRQALDAVAASRGMHLILVDARDPTVQSPALLTEITAWVEALPTRASRMAIVLGQGPVRLQTRRILNWSNSRRFDDPGAARRWLLGVGGE